MVSLGLHRFKQSSTEQIIRQVFGPFGSQMNELAMLTYNTSQLPTITSLIYKRLSMKHPSKHWRVILKTFTVIIFLLQSGSILFVNWSRSNIPQICQRFAGFTSYDVNKIENGEPVRSKIKHVLSLLKNEQELNELRDKFHQLRNDMSIPGLKTCIGSTPAVPLQRSSTTKLRTNNTWSNNEEAGSHNDYRNTKSLDITRTSSHALAYDEYPVSPSVVKSKVSRRDNNKSCRISAPVTSTSSNLADLQTIFQNYNYGQSANTSNRNSTFLSNNPFLKDSSPDKLAPNPFINVKSF